jgi:hypothetical protein
MRPGGSFAAVIASLSLAACAATGESRFPQQNPLTSPESGVSFALERGCLPYLRGGVDPVSALEQSGVERTRNGRPALLLYGRGAILVQVDERGGCYIRAGRGDGAALRAAVLQALQRNGLLALLVFDAGPRAADGSGVFRQELYCMSPAPPAGMVLSTSTDGSHVPLQATLLPRPDGDCAQPTPRPAL